MDLSDPTQAVTATLDGPVLAVLAVAGRPLTVGQVAQRAVRGSEIGIRRSLARLVNQGIVRATVMGRNQVHELNREHVASGIAELLAGLRPELWQRMRVELTSWKIKPLIACVFGSAARGDGNVDSDIDVLLVHPPFPGQKAPRGLAVGLGGQVADALGSFALGAATAQAAPQWERQVDAFRELVQRWTGNPLQIIDLSFGEWRRPAQELTPLFAEIRRDGVELVKSVGLSVWRSPEAGNG